MAQVWFSLACDDQPPWKAQRFGNLFMDDDGDPQAKDSAAARSRATG